MKERVLSYILLDEKVKKFCDTKMTVNYSEFMVSLRQIHHWMNSLNSLQQTLHLKCSLHLSLDIKHARKIL